MHKIQLSRSLTYGAEYVFLKIKKIRASIKVIPKSYLKALNNRPMKLLGFKREEKIGKILF